MAKEHLLEEPLTKIREYKNIPGFVRLIAPIFKMNWGWLPGLCLLSAIGVFLVAMGFNAGRNDLPISGLLFWLGLFILYCPVVLRLASPQMARKERIGLVVLMGMSLYFVKVLHSPLYFTFYDEFLHLRTLTNLLNSGLLFEWNSLIPASPFYPGLEISTSTLVSLSGSDVYTSVIILVGLSRLLLVLALYFFYEEISSSPQLAGIAVSLYMINPTFVYFDSQFAYESLAIPLAIFVLYVAVRRKIKNSQSNFGYTLAALLGIISVVVTHHVTSYLLIIFLILWSIIAFLRGKSESIVRPGSLAILGIVITLIWIAFLAIITINYLYPFVVGSPQELWNIILGEADGRKLFSTWSGEVTPLFDQIIGYVSVLLLFPILLIGLNKIRKSRSNSIIITLALVTLVYPISLAFRLTYWGAEASSRTSASLFVAIAFVLAVGVTEFWLTRSKAYKYWGLAFVSWVAIVFMGGVIIGTPWWQRMPGPYLVVADKRSIEPQGIAAAKWARSVLGPGNRISTDRINSLLMGTYGDQYIVTWYSDGVLVAPVFLSLDLGAAEKEILQRAQVEYIVVDRRLSSRVPMAEFYFEAGEPGTYQYRNPISHDVLTKFDKVNGISRYFDSGDIVIYDVEGWAYEP